MEVSLHYYQFNIGDYASHTKGLSLLEDLAYRRLLDEYYLSESHLSGTAGIIARRVGMNDHVDCVEYILSAFFTKTDSGEWQNERADREISAFKSKQEKASSAGKASANARKNNDRSTDVQRPFNDRSTTVQPNNNQEPITNNQEPRTNIKTKDISAKSRKTKISIEELPEDWKKSALDYWHSKQRFCLLMPPSKP